MNWVAKAFMTGVGAAAAAMLAASAGGQTMPPPPAHDYKAAPAGTYALDIHHTGLIARIPHLGFSYSIFRFEAVSGKLGWNPANPAADTLAVTVEPGSIATSATPGFAEELQGAKFLDTAKFPTATFASTAFHPEGPNRGIVEGSLTLMGVTRPVRFEVTLVGAGKGFRGPVIGVTAKTTLDPKGYGLPPFITGPIELTIDTEFDRQGS